MANTKSAEKAARQSEKRQAQNRIYLGGARTAVKRARAAIDSGDPAAAEAAVKDAASMLDRAATKGVLHKNNASRRKSRLFLALNKAQVKA